MMNCIIKETGELKCLYLEDRRSGIDYSVDFIGNAGDLDNFLWSDVHGAYIVSSDIFDWWHRVLQDQEILEDRLEDLREEYGSDAVHEAIMSMPDVEVEDHAAVLHRILDEAFDDDNLDLEEIRRTMGRYDCSEEKAKQEIRGIISLWKAEDYFGSWTDDELGITKDVDLLELEKKLEAEHPYDEAAGPDVPLEFVGLREYIAMRYQYFLDKLEDEDEDEE